MSRCHLMVDDGCYLHHGNSPTHRHISIMNAASLSIIFGLTSAVLWGAGDFSGGVATKRNNVYIVVFGLSQPS